MITMKKLLILNQILAFNLQIYQLWRKSTIKCEGQDTSCTYAQIFKIIYININNLDLPPSTPCWAKYLDQRFGFINLFLTPYLNIFLKYFSHPCFFEKNHIFFALLVYVCRKKKPKTNPCLIFLQKTDSSVRCILIIIIISYVFYINTHLSMITVHEAIYFYVFQCLDAEYQCFLTGLIISV